MGGVEIASSPPRPLWKLAGCLCARNRTALRFLDNGAAANVVCLRWLEHHNRVLQRKGFLLVATYPAFARFKFGDGRLGEVRRAADASVGIALEVDIPAVSRQSALEAVGGQLDFPIDILTLHRRGVDFLLGVSRMGRRALSVVDFGKGCSEKRQGPTLSASFYGWAFAKKRPDLSDGGLRLPYGEGDLCRFGPPHAFPVRTAVTLGGGMDGREVADEFASCIGGSGDTGVGGLGRG